MNPTRARHQRSANTRAALGVATYLAGAGARSIYNGIGNPSAMPKLISEQRIVNNVIRKAHEPKNLDQASGAFALSTTTTPFFLLLNAILQGSGGTNRTGRQVLCDYLQLRLSFFSNASTTNDTIYRVLVLWDKEARGSAPAVTDLLSSTSTNLLEVQSSYDFDNVPTRFRILKDDTFVVPIRATLTSTTTVQTQVFKHYHVPLNAKTHFYNTSAGTIGDIDSGSLYLCVIQENGSNAPQMGYDSRLVFRDL
jgi:hypothetical protein